MNSTAALQPDNGSFHPCSITFPRIDWASYLMAAINAIAVLINLVHVFVLKKIPSLKGKPYLHVLTCIAAVDIYSALSTILQQQLTYKDDQDISTGAAAVGVVNAIVSASSNLCRCVIFTVASLERLYAICYPLLYGTTKFIKHLQVWLAVTFICPIMVYGIPAIVEFRHMCIHDMLGLLNESYLAGTIMNLSAFVSTIFTAVVLTRVFIELYRMSKRSISSEEAQVKRATNYLILIVIMFYLCLLPGIGLTLAVLIVAIQGIPHVDIVIYFVYFLPCSLYGILNTVIYGWMSAAYREQLNVMIRWPRSNRVQAIQ